MQLENKVNDNDKIQSIIEEVKSVEEILIWGTSVLTQQIFGILKEYGLDSKVKYFADNRKENQGTNYLGLPVLSPEEVINIYNKNGLYIIIAAIYLDEINQQLLGLGVRKNDINTEFVFYNYEKNNNAELLLEQKKNIDYVYSILGDGKSKKVYETILNAKLTLNNAQIPLIASGKNLQYFEEGIYIKNNSELFCDCGSYNGDTLESYINEYGSYEKYIAIEADKKNYELMLNKVQEKNYENVFGINKGVWKEKGILKFNSEGSQSSSLSEEGDIIINVDSLDNILKNDKVTFIKMDIEGAEINALLGAQQVIKRDNPILAICLYHSINDYYEIPLLIKKLNPEYTLFIRHYTKSFTTETVCYAIPNHRLIK